MSPTQTFLIFELHQHDVPQKNTFFRENSDSEEKSIFLDEKSEKIQIFLLAPFHIGELYTKTLTEASLMLELKRKFFYYFYNVFDLNNGKKLWPINIYQFGRLLL